MSDRETLADLREAVRIQDGIIAHAKRLQTSPDYHYHRARQILTDQIARLTAQVAALDHDYLHAADNITAAQARKAQLQQQIQLVLNRKEIEKLKNLMEKVNSYNESK